jgi:hypothetical protein
MSSAPVYGIRPTNVDRGSVFCAIAVCMGVTSRAGSCHQVLARGCLVETAARVGGAVGLGATGHVVVRLRFTVSHKVQISTLADRMD